MLMLSPRRAGHRQPRRTVDAARRFDGSLQPLVPRSALPRPLPGGRGRRPRAAAATWPGPELPFVRAGRPRRPSPRRSTSSASTTTPARWCGPDAGRRAGRRAHGPRARAHRHGLGGLPAGAARPARAARARVPAAADLHHRERGRLHRRGRRRRAHRRRAPDRVPARPPGRGRAAPSPTASRWPATSPGRCSTTSSGATATRSASASFDVDFATQRRTPEGQRTLVSRRRRRERGRRRRVATHVEEDSVSAIRERPAPARAPGSRAAVAIAALPGPGARGRGRSPPRRPTAPTVRVVTDAAGSRLQVDGRDFMVYGDELGLRPHRPELQLQPLDAARRRHRGGAGPRDAAAEGAWA